MDKLRWESAALTDIGTVRKVNEDNCFEAPQAALWCVADGMGGHQKGDVASQMIVETLASFESPDMFPVPTSQIEQRLQRVNNQLLDMATTSANTTVIGSTVAILLFDHLQAHCLWAGDSRIYRLRNGHLTRLTRDHSQVEEMLQAGLIDESEVEHHPSSNVITRAVGAMDNLLLDSTSYTLQANDIFLLCTDGLNKVVSDVEIRNMLLDIPIHQLPQKMIETALARNARDNVTVVVVKYHQASQQKDEADAFCLDDTLPL